MITIQRLSGLCLTVAATGLLAACGTTTLSQVRDGQTQSPVWPTVEDAHPIVPSTVHPNLDALRKLTIGTPKLEVYRLIGHPMYREGIAGVHEWDYVFKLPDPASGQEVTCQYKMLFDDQMLARQSFWNPVACADLVGGTVEAPKTAPVEPHVAASSELSADFLFGFDSARLSPEAPAIIDAKVSEMLGHVQNVDSLQVIGYADRLGSAQYNQALSMRRAQAVKQYLTAQGLPAEVIHTQGRGSAEPVVDCPGAKSPTVVECLKPNRRVRIEVIAR